MNWTCLGICVVCFIDKMDTINIIEHETKLDEMTKNSNEFKDDLDALLAHTYIIYKLQRYT